MTNSIKERERLTELINRFEIDFKEWLGTDPILHPFGPEYTINMFNITQGERLEKIRAVMNSSIHQKQDHLPEQKYDQYDSFIGNYATSLYNEIDKMVDSETNAIPFIDKLNEFTKLYESTKYRDSEVPFYFAHALFCAIIFFFARRLEYEDELASQIAKNVPVQLMRIYDINGTPEALLNYIKTVFILYTNETHYFYKPKKELLDEIMELYSEYGEHPELKSLFLSFFDIIQEDLS